MSAIGSAVRLCTVAGAVTALAASSSSNTNRPPPPPPGAQAGYGASPQSRPMDAQRALGLWKTSFGPVKIERDPEAGPEQVMGVWIYDRAGEEVVGTFGGPLSGNVLHFRWQEPARPRDLIGEGYLVFDPSGQSFTGRWWTVARERGGDWNGWRADAGGEPGPAEQGPDSYPGEGPPSEGPPDDGPPDDGPREEGPAEQAPGPPPEDI
jgi:hypothetical protein